MTALVATSLAVALLRPPALVSPRPPVARSALRPLVRPRAPPPRAESQYATFEALEAELRGYLGTLNATALAGPPYPLKYTELQRAGRVDLVEGCMKFGGYASVGERLGMPIPPPPPPPPPPPSLFLPAGAGEHELERPRHGRQPARQRDEERAVRGDEHVAEEERRRRPAQRLERRGVEELRRAAAVAAGPQRHEQQHLGALRAAQPEELSLIHI